MNLWQLNKLCFELQNVCEMELHKVISGVWSFKNLANDKNVHIRVNASGLSRQSRHSLTQTAVPNTMGGSRQKHSVGA